ncbi:ATP-binding protein [Cerasicoccus frondis]|uniref:ATP-binding protein n=1 Tax=Cerasicoccus frondis TaxID=490090 RepID=UPI00285258CC|nr:ATP-binding protein [Cerasicoccus frondis]
MDLKLQLQSRSLRDKITLIIGLTGLVLLMLSGIGIVIYQTFDSLRALEQELSSNSKLIGHQIALAAERADPYEVKTALSLPLQQEQLNWIAFQRANGEIIYGEASASRAPQTIQSQEVDRMTIQDGEAIYYHRIIHRNHYYGTLALASNLAPVWRSVGMSLLASFSILFACLLVAHRLSARLLDFILIPVRQLAETAGRITRSNNFSLRAIKNSDDELGQLTDAFNHMLVHIEARESELEQARRELETKVKQLNEEQEQLRKAQIRERRLQQRLVIAQRLESQNLRSAKEQAETSSSAKSEFLASMSHEIRTPMNGIMGFASLLKETNLDEEQTELADIIHSSANNLLTLLNDLLDFSKIEAGHIELNFSPFDLKSLLHETESIFQHEIARKELALKIHVSERTPHTVVTDASRLRQILFNLAGNAIKFTDEGTVEIRVDAIPVSSKELLCEYSLNIEVRDTGIGIAESNQARIFNSFTQVDASATKRFGGAGLGLAISKRLTEMLGGEIGVRSKIGDGSTFFITIPVRAASPAKEKIIETPVLTGGRALRVLVAEDSPVSQKLLSALLYRRGHSCQIVESGEELLRAYMPGEFDVVVADVHMPDLDGLTAVAKIRKRESAAERKGIAPAYIVIITADAVGATRQDAMKAGADEYMNKPMVNEEFYQALETARQRLERNTTP